MHVVPFTETECVHWILSETDKEYTLISLYDTMVELEERIEDAKPRKSSILMGAITLDSVYKILQNFEKLYAIMNAKESH